MSQTWWSGIQELKEEQKKIISLPLEASHLILGPPGSGKTNLLLLRANYFARAGHPNILLLVFTRLLREFIVTGGQQYAFDVSKVKTYKRWQYDLLKEYGAMKSLPADIEDRPFDLQREELNLQIQQLITRKRLHNIYDAVLLDEAQDYLPEEIKILATLGKVLFVVADRRQKIYSSPDCFDALQKAVTKVHQLHYNYRCGKKICKFADSIAKDSDDYEPLAPKSQYDEASKPSVVNPPFERKDIDEEVDAMLPQLIAQLKAYPDELLGIVCPKRTDAIRVWELLESSSLATNAVLQLSGQYRPFSSTTRLCVCTLHAAKGLEFRTLHMVGCSSFMKFSGNRRNLVYTAVTRAKTSLSVYYSGRIPAFLEQALADLEPIRDLPDPKDLFGSKS
jgi:superfamily I DNA/RNA helicase